MADSDGNRWLNGQVFDPPWRASSGTWRVEGDVRRRTPEPCKPMEWGERNLSGCADTGVWGG